MSPAYKTREDMEIQALDFEEPIIELEKRIEEIQQLAGERV